MRGRLSRATFFASLSAALFLLGLEANHLASRPAEAQTSGSSSQPAGSGVTNLGIVTTGPAGTFIVGVDRNGQYVYSPMYSGPEPGTSELDVPSIPSQPGGSTQNAGTSQAGQAGASAGIPLYGVNSEGGNVPVGIFEGGTPSPQPSPAASAQATSAAGTTMVCECRPT